MKALTVAASPDQLEQVQNAIDIDLNEHNCSARSQMQIELAVEEILVNISHYAYHPETGEATVQWELNGDPPRIIIRFLDGGHPYNPLEKADPDTALPAEERDIGGLGIYLVKNSMDAVSYEYKDGQNILTIEKIL